MSNNNQKTTLESLIEQMNGKAPGPQKDLWPGVESRIQLKRNVTKPVRAFWYGAVAASLAILTFLGGWQLSVNELNQPTSALYKIAQKINNDQKQQVAQLRTGYQQAGYQYDDSQLLSELDELEMARDEITRALKNSRSEPELLDLLIWVNQQELNLINQSYQPKTKQLQEI
ncbi:hypothetical protein CEW91_03400 [Idiomarina piscisalsi]|uniref:Anti-sigma factor n=1 Tax=Idiomarina piscisalsi TaxID=1096243 RepID=A0ABN5AN74_9GAMM|nr:hypothetical protein [Idiomarina piscisalsi]ASG65254.1 hypothetical protein CEW91_03400 [Idiomarina piscisalsi]